MATAEKAKVFMSGRSQAVRIPFAYRFDVDEVEIRRDAITGSLILSPPRKQTPKKWAEVFARLDAADIPEDFMEHRDQGYYPKREEL